MPVSIDWLLCDSTATDTLTLPSGEVIRPIVLTAHRPPSAERVSQPFFTVADSPGLATAGTPQSWSSLTVFISEKAVLRDSSSSGPLVSTSLLSRRTWSLAVVLVRPHALFTVVWLRPSRLLHLVIAVLPPRCWNSSVVA